MSVNCIIGINTSGSREWRQLIWHITLSHRTFG